MALPQRVIVTGAAQGIGRAVALRLASPGVYLALWDVKREGVEETAKLCCEKGAQSRGLGRRRRRRRRDRGGGRRLRGASGASPTVLSTMREFSRARARST